MLNEPIDAKPDTREKLRPAYRVSTGTVVDRLGAGTRAALVAICCALSVALFFRYQIGNGFTRLFADRFDGIIAIAISEHWYNVFRGFSSWPQTEFLYPLPRPLACSDGYFVIGLIYSGFRALGLDPFLASELGNAVLRAIGFLGAYLACRRVFALAFFWSLLAAALFTLSSSSFNHALHIQLLTISLAPVTAVLLHGALTAMMARRSKALFGWGLSATVLYAAWLMTGYYMAWFFAYFTAAAGITLLFLLKPEERHVLMAAVSRQKVVLLALAIITVVVNLPFVTLYLPKMEQSGAQPYQIAFSPSLLDIPNVGPANILYGDIVRWIHGLVSPVSPLFTERTNGIAPLLLVLFGCACFALWRDWRNSPTLLKAIAVAVVATWITVLNVGHLSLWYFVRHLVPGAGAIRAMGRYQIFLAAPVIVVAVQYLGRIARKFPAPVLIAFCALLVIEQLDRGSSLQLARPVELARLKSVPPPPPTCKVFFASRARPATVPNKAIEDHYSHNVDAMMIAEYLHLPTINGVASVLPRDWALFAPEMPSYRSAVAAFVKAYRLNGLCAIDLRTMQWNATPFQTDNRGGSG